MEVKVGIVILIVLIIMNCFIYGCQNRSKENTIRSYDTIVIDGEEYKTENIETVTRDYLYDEQTYVIVFNDGTKIYTKNYSLKNEGDKDVRDSEIH